MAPTIAPHIKYAAINQAAGATTDVVADPGDSKQVVVLGICLTSDTTGTVLFHDDIADPGPTSLTGEMNLLAGTPLVIGFSPFPLLKGTASQKLQITTTQECNGWIAYTIDTA